MSKRKLLVVEDDRTTAAIIRMHLLNEDYQVIDTVDSGQKAIDSVGQHRPDLVLMDIKLRGSIDGITAADTIIEECKTPVVYVTAHSDENILARAQKTRHSGFINKPLREVDLRTTIKLAIEKNTKARETENEKKALSIESLIKNYSLTRTEASLIMKLLKEPDVLRTAKDSDITINTLRTHLKHIYKKTNTGSKAELLMKIIKEFNYV